MHNKFIYLVLFISVAIMSACEGFLDVGDPPDKISANYVYNSDPAATAVFTGIYYDFQKRDGWAQGEFGVSIRCGLSADEISTISSGAYDAQYKNIGYMNYWSPIYKMVYRINAALEGLGSATGLSKNVKQQLIGEAKFLRAFCYFYLVNFYGNVPLILNADYRDNASLPRVSIDLVYEQIISDLLDSQKELGEIYVDANVVSPSLERLRPNKFVATALLSRVYLYRENWREADRNASIIINNKALFDTVSLNEIFVKNSKEAIWQLQPVDVSGTYFNTLDAKIFVLSNGHSNEHPLYVSQFLLQAFEENDERKSTWLSRDSVSSHFYFNKYKLHLPDQETGEYLVVMRLAEQLLIRAEARVRLGDNAGASEDLNLIRRRAGLPIKQTGAIDLTDILHERQVELFSEWGNRWLDLKRLNELDELMSVVSPTKGGHWEPYKKLFPIPPGEIALNPNLIQNEGYPAY